MTLDILKSSNRQLWFTICLRLGKIYLEQHNIAELDALLTELKQHCKRSNVDGDGDTIMSGSRPTGAKFSDEYDPSKSNLLLETFALEI